MKDFNGFLGEGIETWIKKFRQENKELFDLCVDINRFTHETLSKLIIHSKDGQKILSSAMFTRIVSQYQSIIILMERGLINEAKIILRTMLDGLFILVAMSKDRKYVNYYINDDIEKRKESLNRFSKNPSGNFDDLKKQLPDTEIEKLLQKIKEEKNARESEGLKLKGRINTKQWAKLAELEGLYYRMYSLLNASVHGLSRELEQYADVDATGEIIGMNWGPCIEGIDIALTTAADLLIIALVNIHDLFDIEKSELYEFHRRINDIAIKSQEMRIIPMSKCIEK